MALNFKALVGALGMVAIAAVTMATAVFAQQGPPVAGQELPPNGPAPGAQLRPDSARPALVTADVNLRREPGTNAPIIATIPGGSTVQITSCNGEWCAVIWNGRSGFAIARNLDTGGPRQVRRYPGQPGYAEDPDDGYGPPVVYEAPGYYPPPAVVYGPGYYGPGYYGSGWGRRGRW